MPPCRPENKHHKDLSMANAIKHYGSTSGKEHVHCRRHFYAKLKIIDCISDDLFYFYRLDSFQNLVIRCPVRPSSSSATVREPLKSFCEWKWMGKQLPQNHSRNLIGIDYTWRSRFYLSSKWHAKEINLLFKGQLIQKMLLYHYPDHEDMQAMHG